MVDMLVDTMLSLENWQQPKEVKQAWTSWEDHRASFSICWIHIFRLKNTRISLPRFSQVNFVQAKQLFCLVWFGCKWFWLVMEDCPRKTVCLSRCSVIDEQKREGLVSSVLGMTKGVSTFLGHDTFGSPIQTRDPSRNARIHPALLMPSEVYRIPEVHSWVLLFL